MVGGGDSKWGWIRGYWSVLGIWFWTGRRVETRSGEGAKRSLIDHRNPTGYSQKLDDVTRDADAVGTPAEGWEIERGCTVGLDVIAQTRVSRGLDVFAGQRCVGSGFFGWELSRVRFFCRRSIRG